MLVPAADVAAPDEEVRARVPGASAESSALLRAAAWALGPATPPAAEVLAAGVECPASETPAAMPPMASAPAATSPAVQCSGRRRRGPPPGPPCGP